MVWHANQYVGIAAHTGLSYYTCQTINFSGLPPTGVIRITYVNKVLTDIL